MLQFQWRISLPQLLNQTVLNQTVPRVSRIIASKGPLSNPTAATQPWRWELVLMPEGV
jgi:hypothetical protein